MKREIKYIPCVATTANMTSNTQNETKIQYNYQLHNWKQAKIKYMDLKNSNFFDPVLKKELILMLGQSITDLFGVNYNGELYPNKPERTPSLLEFIKKAFPLKGWVLRDDNMQLYNDFVDFDDIHRDAGKHISSLKLGRIEGLSLDDINKYMETVRKVWIWFLNKKFGNLSENDLEEFKDSYIS